MIPAVIISEQRTGSNLLMCQLDQHKDIKNFGEVFSKKQLSAIPDGLTRPEYIEKKGTDPAGLIKHWICSKTDLDGKPPVHMFKFQYHNIKSKPGKETIKYLHEIGSHARIIHLVRQNAFERFVSKLNAEKTRKYYVSKASEKPKEPDPYRIERNIAERGMKHYLRDVKMVDELIRDMPYTKTVYYEELVNARENVIDTLFQFLQIEPMVTSVVSQKQSIPSRFQIKNYAALRDHFKETAYAEYFEESPGY